MLYEAVHDEDEDQVEYLLHKKEVDPNPRRNLQDNALSMACKIGNLNIVRLLITNKDHPADPNKLDKDFLTPLLHDVNTQTLDLIKLLLRESRVEMDLRDNHYKCTPLAMSVRQRSSVDVCRLLLEHGSDANDPMGKGTLQRRIRVVHHAALSGWPHIVKLLLEHGANITSADSNINLNRMAMQSGNAETLECCLQHAYNKLDDRIGCWHETLVVTAICTESAAHLLPMLLHWGFVPKPCKYLSHRSAFHAAVSQGSYEIVGRVQSTVSSGRLVRELRSSKSPSSPSRTLLLRGRCVTKKKATSTPSMFM